ncbi:TPA: hypothetical protein ACQYBJ_000407 [Vibrio parahaemolyticus]|uniref:hypothetical protein n=1 Tax=Shewanella algae TaxID=38313 RepID=UPI0031F59D8C
MKYADYFSLFLNIETELSKFLSVIDYSEKHEKIYSHKLVLLLLQTCPIIESYLVKMAVTSSTVRNSNLWDCEIKTKIWNKKNNSTELRLDSQGGRFIGNFPKFACVNSELFGLPQKSVIFYHSAKFQALDDGLHTVYRPFISLQEMLPHDHDYYKKPKTNYPKSYDTPKWWSAYNKVKHDFDLAAKEYVNYSNVIEAVAALFCVLAACEPDFKALSTEGYLRDGKIKTSFFESDVSNSFFSEVK